MNSQKTNVETRCQCEDITTEHKEERSWNPPPKKNQCCQCEDITTEHKEGVHGPPENQC